MWFDLKLPAHVIEEVQLSSLQLEAVTYACQQHMNILSDGSRAGFLIGMCRTLLIVLSASECVYTGQQLSVIFLFICICMYSVRLAPLG